MEDLPDGYVSKHFKERELACPCCGKYLYCLRLLNSLEKLRRLGNGAPITVLSGTRCKDHNEDVGGADASKHLTGEAVDIIVQGLMPLEVAILLQGVEPFSHGGVGQYKYFTHLDVRLEGQARWEG